MRDCIHYGNCTICCCEEKPSIFNNLSKTEFDELYTERKEVSFNAGEVIFKQGTTLTHLACLKQGLAKLYYERPEGSNILINIGGPSSLSGSMGLYTTNIHHLTVQALTDVKICLISVKDFSSVLEKSKDMALELIMINNKSIINLTNKLANLTYKSMIERVSDVLLYLQEDIYGTSSFTLNLSRQDLADLAAMTKESFIRTLKELKDSGFIQVSRNKITILDTQALERISNN